MLSRRVLITGGAGFVGANLALGLAHRFPDWQIACLDNLNRRGSELNLPRLREAGVEFLHGDVRDPRRPSRGRRARRARRVLGGAVGTDGQRRAHGVRGPHNLIGAYHCLELVRREGAQLIFLSTSRVYPYTALEAVAFGESDTRYELTDDQELPGVSSAGVAEGFPLDGARTLYGATKLAAELLIAEYAAAFGLRAVVNRCGVIAGPWQMGKVDQGVFTHWMVSHYFGRPLSYIGYGGWGKQVRDVLHVDDLVDLVCEQLLVPERWANATLNVGGGPANSLSLVETTAICRELTGNEVPLEPRAA